MSQTAPVRWPSADDEAAPAWPVPDTKTAMLRGVRGRCPACGEPGLFAGWLKVAEKCGQCGAPVGAIRADDAPPYFTIFGVGHIIVPGMLLLEQAAAPPLWVHSAIWLPATVALAVGLMRPVKGATIGLMLRLGMTKPTGHA